MSLFPRFASGEFTPLFRLLDDYAAHQVSRQGSPAHAQTPLRSFQPRFDVKEINGGYQLEGELPGIDQNNINIEFRDDQTLSISGRVERSIENGTKTAAIEGADSSEQASTTSSNHHKPTVEDETTMTGANPEAEKAPQEQSQVTKAEPTREQPQNRYWVSERSIGQFQRTFSFPSRVDQEHVKASLKDGILSVLIPKAQAPVSRRINIE